ncbi:hypothetical protein ACJD0Z_01305 [Flavobacteriaceae bacterium M23B6Z8]
MNQADRIYKRMFRRHFTNHNANFPPSQPISLGDFGFMKSGYFIPMGNIRSSFGLNFDVVKDQDPTYESFKSSDSVSVALISKGAIGNSGVPAVKAGLEIKFEKEKSLFFSSAEVRYNYIQDLINLGKEIKKLYRQKKWKKRYVLISAVLEGTNTMLAISGSSNAEVKIEAKSDSVKQIELSDASIGLNITRASKTAYEIVSNGELQIGFRLSRLYNPLFSGPELKTYSVKGINEKMDEDPKIDKENLIFGDIPPGYFEEIDLD